MGKRNKKSLTSEQIIAKLSWELLEHKANYYCNVDTRYLNVEQISDWEYDQKEEKYVQLRRLKNTEYSYEIVGFPLDSPSGKLVIERAYDRFKKENPDTEPNWIL